MTKEQFDRLTQYLISNGDVPAVTSQMIYEYAWSQGIRPLRERDLKPEGLVRKSRRGPPERQPGRRDRSSCRGFSILRAMKRGCGGFDLQKLIDEQEPVEEMMDGWWA